MRLFDQIRIGVIILAMAGIAILIHQGQARKEEKKAAALSESQAKTNAESALQAQKIAGESARVQFVNQYVNSNVRRTPGVPLIAVAVATESKTMNHAMSVALIQRFKGDHANLFDSFFKPPVVSDGLFGDIFNGSTVLFSKLEITNSVDGLLLGRQTVDYATNPDLDNVITASMRLEVVTLPVAGIFQSQGWTFAANGTGFRQADARMQAEERIIKQINEKADMTLGIIEPSK